MKREERLTPGLASNKSTTAEVNCLLYTKEAFLLYPPPSQLSCLASAAIVEARDGCEGWEKWGKWTEGVKAWERWEERVRGALGLVVRLREESSSGEAEMSEIGRKDELRQQAEGADDSKVDFRSGTESRDGTGIKTMTTRLQRTNTTKIADRYCRSRPPKERRKLKRALPRPLPPLSLPPLLP
jgi:hypothetical protein